MLFAIVLGMVNRDWPEAAVYRALTDRKNVGGAKVQEIVARKGEKAGRRYLSQVFQKAGLATKKLQNTVFVESMTRDSKSSPGAAMRAHSLKVFMVPACCIAPCSKILTG